MTAMALPMPGPVPVWRPALLSAARPRGRVQCDSCPHRCVLADGQHGYCHVRRNHRGELQTATYAVAAEHVDAIERKPFYHVLPGTRVLTVAGPGCTFRCDYCVNHRLSQYGRDEAAQWVGQPADPAAIVARAVREHASLGMSYTEPGLAIELTLDLARHAGPAGVPLLWKTNGFLTREALAAVAPTLRAVNVDIKASDDEAHVRLTGAPLSPVLAAIESFRAVGVWVEISTPLIPGASAEEPRLRSIARWIAATDPDIPWHLLRFTPDFRMAGYRPTTPGALAAAMTIGHEAGLRYVYVERALGADGRMTRCAGCHAVLVERDVWATRASHVVDGRCPRCARTVPGLWGDAG